MSTLTSICYTGKLVHQGCLEALFRLTSVKAIVIDGPPLTNLPFLTDPESYSARVQGQVIQSSQIDGPALEELAASVDIGLSLGTSRILKRREIEAPNLGTFNLHPSLLPHYRGLHPDIYSLMDGQPSVGITLHRMSPGIDTGDIIAQESECVSPGDTIKSMTERLYSRGAVLIDQFLNHLIKGESLREQPQPREFDPLETKRRLNWQDSAWRINRLVGALTYPWPMAKSSLAGRPFLISKIRVVEDGTMAPGHVLSVTDDAIRVGTGGHSIEILELRNEDREIIPLARFVSEFKVIPGETWFDNFST